MASVSARPRNIMPWRSPRISGWRETPSIVLPIRYPTPTPGPIAPKPVPRPSASALAASTRPSSVSAMSCLLPLLVWSFGPGRSSVLGLDGGADVDAREHREDVCLQRRDEAHLEDVEERRGRD